MIDLDEFLQVTGAIVLVNMSWLEFVWLDDLPER
jgi:hypothetical protein